MVSDTIDLINKLIWFVFFYGDRIEIILEQNGVWHPEFWNTEKVSDTQNWHLEYGISLETH